MQSSNPYENINSKENEEDYNKQQDYDRKAAQLREKNAANKEFCSNASLRTQQERLQVAGWGHKEAAGARSAAKR